MDISDKEIAERIRRVYREGGNNASRRIEQEIATVLAQVPRKQQAAYVERLAGDYFPPEVPGSEPVKIDAELFGRIIRLLFGSGFSLEGDAPEALDEALPEKLDAVEKALDRLRRRAHDERADTLRVEGEIPTGDQGLSGGPGKGLAACLDEIDRDFQARGAASAETHRDRILQLLEELDPDRISEEAGGGILNPLRKTKAFELYENKYLKLKERFQSGKYPEGF